jgi:hypothetical protein
MPGTMPFPFPRSPVPRSTAILGALLLASAGSMTAQESIVSPGERIRVKHACEGDAKPAPCKPVIGKVRAVEGDTIVLDQDGDGERRLVLGPAASVELSGGRHGHALAGLGLGILAGVAVGAIGDQSCRSSSSEPEWCAFWYVFTVPSGALIGVITGALTKSEKWRTVSRPTARFQVLPGVTPDGVGLSGSLRF